jgi:hypothetical protein
MRASFDSYASDSRMCLRSLILPAYLSYGESCFWPSKNTGLETMPDGCCCCGRTPLYELLWFFAAVILQVIDAFAKMLCLRSQASHADLQYVTTNSNGGSCTVLFAKI